MRNRLLRRIWLAQSCQSNVIRAYRMLRALRFSNSVGWKNRWLTSVLRCILSQPSMNSAWYQLRLSYRCIGQEAKSSDALERYRKAQ